MRTASIVCAYCGAVHSVSPKHLHSAKYCSPACARADYNVRNFSGPGNGRWRGGKALSYGPEWKRLKAEIRERDRICRVCGKTPAENGRALDVHHVVPYRFSGDNSPENLQALCRSCHMRADDHGRRGAAQFLRPHRPKGPTKRDVRRLEQRERADAARQRRAKLRAEATRLAHAGLSLRTIAAKLNVSHQTVANWLSGT